MLDHWHFNVADNFNGIRLRPRFESFRDFRFWALGFANLHWTVDWNVLDHGIWSWHVLDDLHWVRLWHSNFNGNGSEN